MLGGNYCKHNRRSRFTSGFYCNDCDTFFSKNTPTYRSDELLSSIWMVLWNIKVDMKRKKKPEDQNVKHLLDEIGIDKQHENYEELISRAEILIEKYGKNSESASIIMDG